MKQISFLKTTFNLNDEEIVITPERYIVKGDITFSRDKFWENYGENSVSGTKAKHYRFSYTVTAVTNVKVYIASGVPFAWITAINSAMSAWNGLGRTLTFSSSATQVPGCITVSYSNLGVPSAVAWAAAPTSSGYPGPDFIINSGFTGTPLTSSQMKRNAVHELGHNIGFDHTDAGVGTLITAVSTTCKNNTDPGSVMLAGTAYWTWVGFSTCDIEAFDALY